MKRISSYFLQGILLVAPVAITIYILYTILGTVDGWLVKNIEPILGFYIPGLGVVILFLILTILGFAFTCGC